MNQCCRSKPLATEVKVKQLTVISQSRLKEVSMSLKVTTQTRTIRRYEMKIS